MSFFLDLSGGWVHRGPGVVHKGALEFLNADGSLVAPGKRVRLLGRGSFGEVWSFRILPLCPTTPHCNWLNLSHQPVWGDQMSGSGVRNKAQRGINHQASQLYLAFLVLNPGYLCNSNLELAGGRISPHAAGLSSVLT